MKKYPLAFCFLVLGFYYSNPLFAYYDADILSVRYNSVCCGIPSVAQVRNYLNQFAIKQKLTSFELEYNMFGYEGDGDLMIRVDKLSVEQKKELIAGLQSVIEGQNRFRTETSGYIEFNPDLH